jgi:hypothetical protein
VRGPPITITCECGERQAIRYGRRWTCERCGRTWDTAQIPREEYQALVRAIWGPRLLAIGVALAVGLALLVAALIINPSLVLTIPIALGALAIFLGPLWKRQVRRRLAERPRWEIRPE